MRQPAPKIGDPRRIAAHIFSPGSTDPIECTGIAKSSFSGPEGLLVFRRWRRASVRHLPIQEPKIGVQSWSDARRFTILSGIGEIGPEAYRFADWLADAGQKIWAGSAA